MLSATTLSWVVTVVVVLGVAVFIGIKIKDRYY
jgi:hypothetical protein